MSIGIGNFSIKAKFSKKLSHPLIPNEIPIRLYIFTDKMYLNIMKAEKCIEKINLIKQSMDIMLPSNGEWSKKIELNFKQSKKPTLWVSAIADCKKKLHKYSENHIDLEFIIDIYNNNMSNLPYDLEDKAMINILEIVCMINFLLNSKRKNKTIFSYNESNNIYFENPSEFLNISLFLHIFALTLETINLLCISYYDSRFKYLEIIKIFIDIFADYMIIWLAFLISKGVFIFKKIIEYNYFISVWIIILGLEVLFLYIDRNLFEDNNKLHNKNGLFVLFLCLIRFFFVLNFTFFCFEFYKNIKNSGKMKLFILKFGFLIILYLIASPILNLTGIFLLPLYLQAKVISFGNNIANFLIYAGLSYFIWGKNEIFEIIRNETERKRLISSEKFD